MMALAGTAVFNRAPVIHGLVITMLDGESKRGSGTSSLDVRATT
jgi:hypothetical protein